MGMAGCGDRDMIHLLKSLFGSNTSAWDAALRNVADDCKIQNNSSKLPDPTSFDLDLPNENGNDISIDVYAFVTPIIILTGLFGNTVSLFVFASRRLRKLSASLYLAAISVSDTMVLLTYVFLEWLNKGLPRWPGGHRLALVNVQGVCQSFLYCSYLFRFISVWILVIFTMERYIAACRPLQRRAICTKTFGRRAILTICCVSGLLSLYKPLLSGVFSPSKDASEPDILPGLPPTNSQADLEPAYSVPDAQDHSEYVCTRNPDYDRVNFVMEVTYGLVITAVPFVVIAVFNMLILRTIMQRDANIRKWKIAFKDSRIRWEFTVTLLVVSSSFICLNLPYFVTWCQQFMQSINPDNPSEAHRNRNQLFLTRTIFNLNYCINFFLYCLTGTYYRRQVAVFFCCRSDEHAHLNGATRKYSTSCATGTTKL